MIKIRKRKNGVGISNFKKKKEFIQLKFDFTYYFKHSYTLKNVIVIFLHQI